MRTRIWRPLTTRLNVIVHPWGNPLLVKNHSELVAHKMASAANVSEPMTGNIHPGSLCDRTDNTLAVNSPKKKHPATEWITVRGLSQLVAKPNDHRQWNTTGSVSANASVPDSRCASPYQAGIDFGNLRRPEIPPALPGAARALALRSAGGRSGPGSPLCRGPLGRWLSALPGAARALAGWGGLGRIRAETTWHARVCIQNPPRSEKDPWQ